MIAGFHLSPRAQAEHDRIKREAIIEVSLHLKTADQAWIDYVEILTRLLREARQEVDDERMIQTKCTDCGFVHTMRAAISHYQCQCNPRKDRFPFNERFVIEAEEK